MWEVFKIVFNKPLYLEEHILDLVICYYFP